MLVSLFDRKRAGNISETLRIAWPLMLAQVANAANTLFRVNNVFYMALVALILHLRWRGGKWRSLRLSAGCGPKEAPSPAL